MTSEPMTPERFAAIKARHQEVKRLYGEFWVDAGPTDADLDAVLAEVERLRCTDPIECGHEAALGQANEQLAAVWALVEPWRSADFVSASLRDLVYGLLAIRDRADLAAESSSPTEEKA